MISAWAKMGAGTFHIGADVPGVDPHLLAVTLLDLNGDFFTPGGAMKVLETGHASFTGTKAEITVPEAAYGGISLSSDGASPAIIWVSVDNDAGTNSGYRVTAGGFRHLDLRDCTLHLNAITTPCSMYYTIYGI